MEAYVAEEAINDIISKGVKELPVVQRDHSPFIRAGSSFLEVRLHIPRRIKALPPR